MLLSVSVQAAEKAAEKAQPATQEIAMLTLEATVESIDREARKVTLKNKEGESKTLTLDEDAGRLDAVDVGDLLTIQYLASITIQVLGPDDVQAGAASEAIIAQTKPGEKPAALAATETSIVVTIENIDLENDLVTIKGEDGELETVTPRNPENLKKVKVGDKVKITYTEAIGFSVTEQPAAK
jgi:Cu/Ag efflux protein CusF